MNHRRTLLAAIASLAIQALPAAAATLAETREPVKIFFVNSSDSDFINAVYGEVLKEFGYRVRYVQADFVAHFSALQTGDIDVSLGAWQTNGADLTKQAVASGKVENYGPSGVKITEGWWYSNELKASCPGLPNWEALRQPACVKALVTADTAPKGRYVDAPADWGSDAAASISKKGLQLTSINSGSPGALVATVKGALDRKAPILAWGFLPHWLYTDKNGAFVQTPEQQARTNVDVLKLANKKTMATIPHAATVLRNFQLDSGAVQSAMMVMDNDGQTPEQAARAWMAKHSAVWQGWAK